MGICALVLAAGLGTRLRPLTNTLPKCLVSVGEKPLLNHWIEKLNNVQCENIIVNTHHLSDQVEAFCRTSVHSEKIRIFHESQLLGTAGTLLANKHFFMNNLGILIHADNYTEFDMKKLIAAHDQRPKECILTMLTFTTGRPENCGIVVCDKIGIVREFHEKVTNPPGTTANGAIYAFSYEFLDNIEKWEPKPKDFSVDVLPRLLGRIYTIHTESYFLDIGTPETLRQAQRHVDSLEFR